MVTNKPEPHPKKRRSLLLGLGLDNDEHVRITRGKNFHLLGGSQQTHESMQEQAIKLNEKLDQRGRELDEISRAEFVDLAREVGMTVVPEDVPDDEP